MEIFLKLTRETKAQPEKQWLAAKNYDICLEDGTAVGKCDLRIGHNERVYIGGNIGYEIAEEHRGHRYAAKACALLLEIARENGMDYLYITCDPANVASARTCEIVGGTLVETAKIPEEHDMYAEGKRFVQVYRFNL